MWAYTIHAPYDGRYALVDAPNPGPGEALVRVRAVAICGTDLEIYQGTMAYFTLGMARYPIIPGHEWSGEVERVGPGVTGLKPGDRVAGECTISCGKCPYCRNGWYNLCPGRRETGILNLNGAFAEYVVLPAHFLHNIGTIPFEDAAMVETSAIAVYAVRQAAVNASDRVAVLGTGPVGLQLIQAARANGAREVVAVGGRPSRRALARELGAEEALAADDPCLEERVLEHTAGQRFDVVLEASGNPAVTGLFGHLVRPHGRLVMTGLFGGKQGAVDLDWLVTNNITLLGSLGSPNVWEETIYLISSGKIVCSKLVTHRFSLSQAGEALQYVGSRPAQLIKAVLIPSS